MKANTGDLTPQALRPLLRGRTGLGTLGVLTSWASYAHLAKTCPKVSLVLPFLSVPGDLASTPLPPSQGSPRPPSGAMLAGSRATPRPSCSGISKPLPLPGPLQLSQSRAELTKPQDFHITGTGTLHSPPLAPCARPCHLTEPGGQPGAAFQLQIPDRQITKAAVCSPRLLRRSGGGQVTVCPPAPLPTSSPTAGH